MKPSLLKTFIIAGCCSLAASFSFAQKKGEEYREIFVPIDGIGCESEEGTAPCYVEFNIMELGLLPSGSTITFRSAYTEENKNPTVLLEKKGEDTYYDYVTLPLTQEEYNKMQGLKVIAQVKILSDAMGHRGIFTELADQAIQFITVNEDEFYGRTYLNEVDCPAWEREIIKRMTDDIHYTAAQMRGNMDPYPLKGGIYDGRELFDAMEATQMEDVRLFLGYVLARPQLYMGGKWKISEVYATWLSEQSPSVAKAHYDALAKKDLAQIIPSAIAYATKAGLDPAEMREIVRYSVAQSAKLDQAGDKTGARKSLEVAVAISNHMGDPEYRALAKHSLGAFLGVQSYSEAVGLLKEAEALYSKANRRLPNIRVFADLAQIHNLAGKPKAALKSCWDGHALADAWEGQVENSDDVYQLNADLWYQQGKAEYVLGQYEDAEGSMWSSLDFLDMWDAFAPESRRKQGRCYLLLADISKAKQEPDMENEYRQEAEKLLQMAAEGK